MLNLTTLLAAVALTISSIILPSTHITSSKMEMKKGEIATMTITSSAFKANEMIPDKYTCKGSNMSPPIHIEGIPEGTKGLVMIMDDPDAQMDGGFNHWIAWNLDPTMIDIPEGYHGGSQGFNTGKHKWYTGPCPPQGTHHYHFKVYATKKLITVPPDSYKDKVEKAMKPYLIGQGELIGLYTKNK